MANKLISKAELARICGVTPATITGLTKRRLRVAMVGSRVDLSHPDVQQYVQEKTAPQPEERVPGVDTLFEEALGWCRQSDRWTASGIQRHFKIGYARAVRVLNQLQAAGHVPKKPERDLSHPEKPKSPPSGQSPALRPPPRQHWSGRRPSWQDDNELIEVPDDIEQLADLTLRELIEKFGTGYRFHDWLKSLKEIEAVNEKRIKNAQSRGKLISRHLVEVGVIDPFNSAHVRLMTDGAKAITAAVLAKHQAGISEQKIEAYVTDVVGSFIRPVKAKVERNLRHVEND